MKPFHRRMGAPLTRLALCAAATGSLSCGGDGNLGPSESVARLRFEVGGDVRDTVFAMPEAPLVVAVLDENGMPRTGVAVELVGSDSHRPNVGEREVPEMASSATGPFSLTAVATTDDAGRAKFWVRFGRYPRTGFLVARTIVGWNTDTVQVVTIAGNAVTMTIPSPDTAIVRGGVLSPGVHLFDRLNNLVATPPRLEVESGPLVVANGSITTTGFGRGYLLVTGAGRTVRMGVTVVPDGVVAVHAQAALQRTDGVYVMRTDGSNGSWPYGDIWSGTIESSNGLWPTWSPSAGGIVIVEKGRLRYTSGSTDLVSTPPAVSLDHAPQYSADGQWIYFTRGQSPGLLSIWRIRADGTELKRLTDSLATWSESSPSPSPDGSKLAFASTRQPAGIWIGPADGGTASSLGVAGISPRWSPLGDRIGVLTTGDSVAGYDVALVTPTGMVSSSFTGAQVAAGFAWSSDGAWIVSTYVGAPDPKVDSTKRRTGLQFLSTSTGERLSTVAIGDWGATISQPSWRPR
jgi:hypothetical protein